MEQNPNSKTQNNCDYEVNLLKKTLDMLREVINTIISKDFDINNPKSITELLINLIIAEADIEFVLKCLDFHRVGVTNE